MSGAALVLVSSTYALVTEAGAQTSVSAPAPTRVQVPARRQAERVRVPAPHFRDQERTPAADSHPEAVLHAAKPTAIHIPAIDVKQDLVELGVVGTSLQVPDDYSDIGWWRGGPRPGERGAAVIVGHVDSPTGPAAFYRLSGLRPGHQLSVSRENGSKLIFRVTRIAVFDRTSFPSTRVYRSHGRPGLNLLTCGGTFLTSEGHYSGNVVVFTDLVRRIPAPEPPRAHARHHAPQSPLRTKGFP